MSGARRGAHSEIALVVVAAVLAMLANTCNAKAQDDIVALERADPAPFAGMLVPDDVLMAWRHEIERLRFELDLTTRRNADVSAADAALCAARIEALEDTIELRERLWNERAAELTVERDRARAERGPRWWQRGGFWLPVGVVIGAVTTAVIATR